MGNIVTLEALGASVPSLDAKCESLQMSSSRRRTCLHVKGGRGTQPESNLTSNQSRNPEFRAGRGHCRQHTQMFHITNEETKAQGGESAC